MNERIKLIFIVVLLFSLCFIPVSGRYIVTNGTFSDSNGFMQSYRNYTHVGGTGMVTLSGIYFRKTTEYPDFNAIKYNTPEYSMCAKYNTTSNYSAIDAHLHDYAGNIVSSGVFGYTCSDKTGEWYIYYFADTWDIIDSTNTSAQILRLDYNRNTFDIRCKEFAYSDTTTDPKDTDVAFTSSTDPTHAYIPAADIGNADYYTTEYTDNFVNNWELYKDTESSIYYNIEITKEFVDRYASQIKVAVNNCASTVFDQYSNEDEVITGIHPSAFAVCIYIWAKNNTYTDSVILYTPAETPTGSYALNIDKGETTSNKLEADETTNARLTGDLGPIKQIDYAWTEEKDTVCSESINGLYQEKYRYNSSISNCELFFEGFGNNNILTSPVTKTLSQVKTIPVQFNWTDSSSCWYLNDPPNNYVSVYLFDYYNNEAFSTTKEVYVGTTMDYAITSIYALDAYTGATVQDTALYVYDDTDSSYIINGELISAKRMVELPYDHNYIIWGVKEGYYLLYERVANTIFYQTYYLNYTPFRYSNTDIKLYMNNLGPTGNTSVLFLIQNENKLIIPDAKCAFTTDGITTEILSNTQGNCWFTAMNNKTYTYEVSKSGYQSVLGSFYTNQTINKVITLYPYTTPTGTATVTPTPTPTTTIEPEEEITCTNFIDCIFAYFRYLGIDSIAYIKLILAMFIILMCIIITGYITRSGEVALAGGAAGFVICLGLGLIPIWVLIAMVILFGLYLARKGGTQ